MKQLLFLLFSIILFTSCSDDDNNNQDPIDQPTEQNKYKTGTDLSKTYPLAKPHSTFTGEAFHSLGYGYDITGKYAHPDWIRKKIVDAQKFEDDHYYDVMHHWKVFVHGGWGTKTGTREDITAQLLKDEKIVIGNSSTEHNNIFKAMFEMPFENDTTYSDLKYYYAMDAFVSSWYEHYFDLRSYEDLSILTNYLTDEFKSDLNSKSADEIIKLYGTHVLMDIIAGWRQDFYYRSTSNSQLQEKMVSASGRFLSSTPGILMEPLPQDPEEKENLYSEYISGVNPTEKPNAWMFDITNYEDKVKFDLRKNAIERESTVLVDFGKRSLKGAVIPIYEFVADAAKKEALTKAYQAYLNK